MAREGKIIDKWRFETDGGTVEVPVRMHTPSYSKTVHFKVSMESPEIELEDVDINKLKAATEKAVKEQMSMVWEDWLHVEVSGDITLMGGGLVAGEDPEDAEEGAKGEAKIELEYRPIQLTTFNEKKMHRRPAHSYSVRRGRREYGRTQDGWPETGHPESSWSHMRRNDEPDKSRVKALIRDTPENRAALDTISRGFQALHSRLLQLLAPESIEPTLLAVNTSGLNLLPAPPPAPEPAKKGKKR